MPATGRPTIGPRVAVRVPDALLAALDERARRAGVTRAEAVRVLLERALAPHDDGVDRAQIAARLRLTPAQRIATMSLEVRRMLALNPGATGAARRVR